MRYQLPPHVRMCHTPRGAVFLDMKRNRYTGLSPAASALLHSLLSTIDPDSNDDASGDAQRLTRRLLDAQLIEPGTGADPVRAPRTPVATIGFEQLAPVGCGDKGHPVRFARAYVWARCAVHRRLWDALRDLNQRRTLTTQIRSAHEVATIARGFHRLRPYAFTARDQCLLHALALMHYLAASAVAATWVIGVQAEPWGAHSWVQWQDIVLDATPEQTAPFIPILIA